MTRLSSTRREPVEHYGGQSTEAQPKYTEHPEDVRGPAGLYLNTPTSIDEPTGEQRAEDEFRAKTINPKQRDSDSEADQKVAKDREVALETAKAEAEQVAEDAKRVAKERDKASEGRQEVKQEARQEQAESRAERREERHATEPHRPTEQSKTVK